MYTYFINLTKIYNPYPIIDFESLICYRDAFLIFIY